MFLIGDADHGMMKQKGEILRDLHRRESGEYSEVGERRVQRSGRALVITKLIIAVL